MIVAARTVHFATAVLLFGELLFAVAVATPVWHNAGRAALERREGLLSLALVWGMGARGERHLRSDLARRRNCAHEWHCRSGRRSATIPSVLVLGGTTLRSPLGLAPRPGHCAGRAAAGDRPVGRPRARGCAWRLSPSWSPPRISPRLHGPAMQPPGRRSRSCFDVVHLLAAGAWLGGLPGLVVAARTRAAAAELPHRCARRFSTLGVLSVGALVVSGLGNALVPGWRCPGADRHANTDASSSRSLPCLPRWWRWPR